MSNAPHSQHLPVRWALACLALWLATCPLLANTQPSPGRRVALLMGNGAYTHAPRLPGTAGDVREMEAALKALGFQVSKLTDGDQRAMKRALLNFGTQAQGAEVALLYFSGHGAQSAGVNYLLPVNAQIEKEGDYYVEAVSANEVLAQLTDARPRTAVIVLDACRDNPAASSATKSNTKGLARMAGVPTGTLVAYATEPGNVASDNGHYARVLAAELRKKQELLDVFRNTTAEVRRLSAGKQVPRISEVSLEERVYLAGEGASPRPVQQVASLEPQPVQGWLDLGDLKQQAQADAKREKAEADALARMQADYQQVEQFSGNARLKAQAWEKFLAAWPETKVPGSKGQSLRQEALAQREQAQQGVKAASTQTGGTTALASGKACAECPETVELPPGSFDMGSPASEAGRFDNEGPVHRVTLKYRLAVGKYPVTRGEFAVFVNATGYQTEAEQGGGCDVWNAHSKVAGRSWRNPGFAQGDDHPVVCVSWNDAQNYIVWLNGHSQVKGWRLLSEAEYEYAARAGSTTAYPWGTLASHEYSNYGQDNDRGPMVSGRDQWEFTSPVDAFPPNKFGLYDMNGNVIQWVLDVYHFNYENAPIDGIAWLRGGVQDLRVVRGGSWLSSSVGLRSAARFAGRHADLLGFRLARTVSEKLL